ncbi:MAG: hypothetical protein U0835_06340 [Isosphaeraceae bacterium]
MKPLALILGVAVFLSTVHWYLVERPGRVVSEVAVAGRQVLVRQARSLKLPPVPGSPVGFDCNNPVYRDGDSVYCFTSHEHPFRGVASGLESLGSATAERVRIDNDPTWKEGGRWIESVYKHPGGRLYAWYHNEPPGVVPLRPELTAPRVGQMFSDDDGLNWHDQGIVLDAEAESFSTNTLNQYFGGGHGDFTVIPDRTGAYFYFLFSTYPRETGEQGVAIARMPAAEIEHPAGKVTKWHDGRWSEPGLGGRATPVFGVGSDWHGRKVDALWGPSVHWNSHLKEYVVLLNHASDGGFRQSGVYIAFSPRLDDPSTWTRPAKLMDESVVTDLTGWYPQVVGTDAEGRESDREAGRVSRLFVRGRSDWILEFR